MAVSRRKPMPLAAKPKRGLPNPRPNWMVREMGLQREPFKPKAAGTFNSKDRRTGPEERRGTDSGSKARKNAPFDGERK